MAKAKKLIVVVDLHAHRFDGFRNQSEALDFAERAKRAVYNAYRKALNLPKESVLENFVVMGGEVLGIIPTETGGHSSTEFELDEFDGTVKVRAAKEDEDEPGENGTGTTATTSEGSESTPETETSETGAQEPETATSEPTPTSGKSGLKLGGKKGK